VTAADAQNRFLENMPSEIIEVLQWHADARSEVSPSQGRAEFAGRFLGGVYEDGAVLPTNLAASPPEVLALVLLQHRTSLLSADAWLILGFALRRMSSLEVTFTFPKAVESSCGVPSGRVSKFVRNAASPAAEGMTCRPQTGTAGIPEVLRGS
jgi:hypothetical protein